MARGVSAGGGERTTCRAAEVDNGGALEAELVQLRLRAVQPEAQGLAEAPDGVRLEARRARPGDGAGAVGGLHGELRTGRQRQRRVPVDYGSGLPHRGRVAVRAQLPRLARAPHGRAVGALQHNLITILQCLAHQLQPANAPGRPASAQLRRGGGIAPC
jgi:hypothetical protein